MKWLLTVAACLPFALGCNVSSYADGVTTPTPRADQIRYVALGDSFTIGTSIHGADAWPNQLVEALGDRVPLELVGNLAVNGYTSDDLIQAEIPALANLQPDFVSILIGVNDVVRGVPTDRYRTNVAQILGAVLGVVAHDRIVVVSTPDYTRTPRGAEFGDPEQQRAAIEEVNAIMAAEAAARGIAFVDISSVADQAATDRSLVATDLLHPSAIQYGRWVDLIAPVVEGLFR